LRRRGKETEHGEIDLGMAVIAGGIDEPRQASTLDEDIAGPKVAMEQGRRRIRGNERAQSADPNLDAGTPGAVQQAGGGEQPLFAPEAHPVLTLAIVECDRAECVIELPAI